MARPSLLTRERHDLIVQACMTGMSLAKAANLARIGERTLNGWIARGRKADADARLDGHEPEADPSVIPEADLPFWQLVQDLENGRAQLVQSALLTVREAHRGWDASKTTVTVKTIPVVLPDGTIAHEEHTTTVTETKRERAWQAGAWLLERLYPDEFGRRTTTVLAGDRDHPVVVEDGNPKADLDAELAELAERIAEVARIDGVTPGEVPAEPS